MRFIKKTSVFLLIMSLCIVSIGVTTPSFATTNDLEVNKTTLDDTTMPDDSSRGIIDVTDLNDDNDDVTISEVMTYDEMAQEIANDQNISLKKAKSVLGPKTEISTDSVNAVTASTATYRTLSKRITVTSSYKPTLKFYCKTSESTAYWGILSILNVGMDRNYNGTTKGFGGTIYTNLLNNYQIFYIVNGDFYDNGTTTVGGSVTIPIGGEASISFNISNSSNFYKYLYLEETWTTQ